MNSLQQYYETLGLQPGASPTEVKQAYRALAKTWHPDRFNHDSELRRQAEEKLKDINEAYRQLKDYQPTENPHESSTASSSSSSARTTVSTKPTNAEFWYNRGAENAQQGRYKDALDDFSMAIRLNPTYVEAYRYRGFAHSMLGFELGAESDLRKAKVLELERKRAAETVQSNRDRPPANSSPKKPWGWNWGKSTRKATQSAQTPPPQPAIWICEQTFRDHADGITAIAVNRDGKFLVSGSRDATVKFWNLRTGMVFHTLAKHDLPITAIALSLDGQLLATGSEDHTIKLWDLKQGILLRALTGHSSSINALAFSPDHRILISGGQDGKVGFWTLKTSRIAPTFQRQESPILAVALSPDGQLVMSGSENHILTLYQARTGELLRSLLGHTAGISSIAMNSDGRLFATGEEDGTIQIWAESAIVTSNPERLLAGHSDAVRSLAFSPDGQLLASASGDRTIQLWNPMNGERLAILSGHTDSINSIVFSPDGHTLFSGSTDKTVKHWHSSRPIL
uniref:Tetratricopeptide repeat protein n=1 Tax=Oscillatoriales cyanobacterium SpSt-402 TaxID=2282168 RepID=A0A832M6E7_9CYAN